jgi:hypothetical protein
VDEGTKERRGGMAWMGELGRNKDACGLDGCCLLEEENTWPKWMREKEWEGVMAWMGGGHPVGSGPLTEEGMGGRCG